jgi:hypothetical protein
VLFYIALYVMITFTGKSNLNILNTHIMKTDRELAIDWWNNKSIKEKLNELKKIGLKRENVCKLSESEIEWIWINLNIK